MPDKVLVTPPPARTPASRDPPREGPAATRARPQGRGARRDHDAFSRRPLTVVAADYRPQRAARGPGGHGGGGGGGGGCARLRGGGAVHPRLPRGRPWPLLAAAAGAARPLAGGGGGGRGGRGRGRSGGAGLRGGDGGRAAGRVQVVPGAAGGVGGPRSPAESRGSWRGCAAVCGLLPASACPPDAAQPKEGLEPLAFSRRGFAAPGLAGSLRPLCWCRGGPPRAGGSRCCRSDAAPVPQERRQVPGQNHV